MQDNTNNIYGVRTAFLTYDLSFPWILCIDNVDYQTFSQRHIINSDNIFILETCSFAYVIFKCYTSLTYCIIHIFTNENCFSIE